MKTRATTIFNQLIFNVAIPTLFALMVFALINFQHTHSTIVSKNEERNRLISEQVTNVIEFQDIAFDLIDQELTRHLETLSDALVNRYLVNTSGIEHADLFTMASDLKMDLRNEDIYIVSRSGEVVNTTFAEDWGLNLFSFGDKHREHLLHVFDTGVFVPELFTVEAKTLRPRKYSYQTTRDRNYIVELGVYSSKADEIIQIIEDMKLKMIDREKGIIDVELFMMADRPFSLNSNALLVPEHDTILYRTFVDKDTLSVYEKTGRSWLHYQYIYMPRLNTNLYEASVIRIISDRTTEKYLFRTELFRFAIILALTLALVTSLIYRKTRVITSPIKKLVDSVDRITNGHLTERAEVTGNNEITRLSERFNMMIAQLESYYYELEEKVKERTRKIENQKEEILKQRDELATMNCDLQKANTEIEEQKKHIMDSIYYARRIQTAILPSQVVLDKLLPSSFIFYLPKDIVSGDFYWVHESEGHRMVAAVDCTGHGVPGAFMSIVGFNELNHAVNVAGALKASEILNELNRGVIETLNEGVSSASIRDGMDIALCVFPPGGNNIYFAGANNPLIIIRNNEIIKVKGDRIPIGAFEGLNPQSFTNHEMEVFPGDVLYLFSDGFADQFGGKENKKFLTGRSQHLLLEIHHLPPDRQKEELHRRLVEWMGNNAQVDDI
ncbi:MAG: SpoIIE family protein phosphatase, partial [Bacteroidales bacterium]|nr:SpoIIE family protein phosphatase [Bacteroidales bacterium]